VHRLIWRNWDNPTTGTGTETSQVPTTSTRHSRS
jgi:hypothetical protein